MLLFSLLLLLPLALSAFVCTLEDTLTGLSQKYPDTWQNEITLECLTSIRYSLFSTPFEILSMIPGHIWASMSFIMLNTIPDDVMKELLANKDFCSHFNSLKDFSVSKRKLVSDQCYFEIYGRFPETKVFVNAKSKHLETEGQLPFAIFDERIHESMAHCAFLLLNS